MTAPDTNLKRQRRRHRGPLIGIALVLLVVAGLAIGFLGSSDDAATDIPAQPTEATPPTAEGAASDPAADQGAPPQATQQEPAPAD